MMMTNRICCLAAAALFVLSADVAMGAEGAIYRCLQPGGALLYSDNPCNGATVVDVHPGRADPNAKERLARAQAQLDRAAAEHAALEREAALRRAERQQAEAAQAMAEPVNNASDVYYGTGYDGYADYTPRRMQRSNLHGGGRGHRSPSRDHVQKQGRVPAVIRRPHPPR